MYPSIELFYGISLTVAMIFMGYGLRKSWNDPYYGYRPAGPVITFAIFFIAGLGEINYLFKHYPGPLMLAYVLGAIAGPLLVSAENFMKRKFKREKAAA